MIHGNVATEAPIVVVAFNGRIFGMNPTSGERAWSYEVGSFGVRIAFSDDRVFAINITTIICLDYRTGVEQWKAEWKCPATATDASLLVQDERVFIGGGGTVTCYSAVDGKQLWRDEYKGQGHGSVSIGVPGNVAQAIPEK
jgi:outer membrane protein assembly factor BamB